MADESHKKPIQGLAKELGWDWVKGAILLLFPTVTSVVTAVSGVMRDLPIWAIVTATTVTFAAVITSIRGFVDVDQRIRIKGRLVYAGAIALVHQKPNGVIDKLGVAVNFLNQSAQAIEYKVIEVHLVIDGRVQQKSTLAEAIATIVPPQVTSQFRADAVDVSAPRPGRSYDYTYRGIVRYGAPGDMKYAMELRLRGSFVTKSTSEVSIFEAFFA